MLFTISVFAQPSISSISPSRGPVGTSVSINGSNFSSTPNENIVYFGPVRANVTTTTATSLTVNVPTGATCQPITVTTNRLTAWSDFAFVPTFAGGGTITPASFALPIGVDTVSAGSYDTRGLAIADFDSDGKPDFVVADREGDNISVFKNSSVGGVLAFEPKKIISLGKHQSLLQQVISMEMGSWMS